MAAETLFDVAVIGAGPGGYTAAIRAAQLGLRVACVDDWRNDKGGPAPGGTCTNIGCIPSKALLHSSENFENAKRHFGDHGIRIESVAIDVEKMLARKATVVRQNNEGILYLFKKNKITFFHGQGRFEARSPDGYRIAVADAANTVLSAPHVIVATGSVARPLPGLRRNAGAVQRRRAGHPAGAAPARRDRRGRGRPRARLRVAAPGLGGDAAGGVAG